MSARKPYRRRYLCPCGEAFPYISQRELHWKDCPMGEPYRPDLAPRACLVPCWTCGEVFDNPVVMGIHRTRVHFVEQARYEQRRS
jgi:hypothetical protein